MKPFVILDTYFNINHNITEEIIEKAFNGNVKIVSYDDFNTGADLCGFERLRSFIGAVNPNRQIYFYAINDINILKLVELEKQYPNFKILRDFSDVPNQYSKTAQMKFLEKNFGEYLPKHTFLNSNMLIKNGVGSGSRGNISCTDDMILVEKIDAKASWIYMGYAENGNIKHKSVGNIEGTYYHSGSKFLELKDNSPLSLKFESIVERIIKEFNLTGIFELEMLEDNEGNLWYVETNFRPAIWCSDFLEDGVVEFINSQR